MTERPSRIRKTLITGAHVAGATFGAAGIAAAATSSSSTSSGSSATNGSSGSTAPSTGSYGTPPAGTSGDPAAMSHGPGETLLTGTDLQKADSAATAAVPGATIIRAETDSSGNGKYEVHMKKSDGTYVTVELDSGFNVTGTVSGFGRGPAGAPDGHGTAPAGQGMGPGGQGMIPSASSGSSSTQA